MTNPDPRPATWTSRLTHWDPVRLAIFAYVAAALVIQVGAYFWWQPPTRTWVVVASALPIALPMAGSLIVVALHARAVPLIPRHSVLWRWVSGVARATGWALTLTLAVLIGAVTASGLEKPSWSGSTASSLQLLVYVVTATLLVAVLVWTIVVAVDMARLGPSGRAAAARKTLTARRRPRGLARLVAELSDPAATGLVGLLLVLVVVQLCVGVTRWLEDVL